MKSKITLNQEINDTITTNGVIVRTTTYSDPDTNEVLFKTEKSIGMSNNNFKSELTSLLNKYSIDAKTNTEDYKLAELIINHINLLTKVFVINVPSREGIIDVICPECGKVYKISYGSVSLKTFAMQEDIIICDNCKSKLVIKRRKEADHE